MRIRQSGPYLRKLNRLFPVVHIFPTGDLRSHWLGDSIYCHCQPDVMLIEGRQSVLHNAYDGREFSEDEEWRRRSEYAKNSKQTERYLGVY